jgi:hypothetical protein
MHPEELNQYKPWLAPLSCCAAGARHGVLGRRLPADDTADADRPDVSIRVPRVPHPVHAVCVCVCAS